MNSYERVFARMAGQPVDRIPNLSIVMQFAGDLLGVPYGKMVSDYRVFADAMCLCQERFALDCLWAISDPMREAEGLGAQVTIPEDAVPYSPVPLIQDVAQIPHLRPIPPEQGRRMNDRLEAVRLLRQRGGNTLPVIGWVEGPFAEACDLMGLDEVMFNLYDEEEAVHQLLSITLEQAKAFALAQIEAGADLIGIGDAAASLVGPDHYRAFVLPYQQQLVQAIHHRGVKVKLHICGNINRVVDLAAASGADMIDCDHMVDLRAAAQAARAQGACVCGNFDPVGVVLHGTPQEVARAVEDCARLGTGTNFIAPGCEVPRGTPHANLEAIHQALCAMGPQAGVSAG